MRKCYQSFKRLLTGQEGSMAPAAVAAAIAMLLIILGVSEYMRLVIRAAGIRDAMESAVVSVVNDNYNEVYHGVREGYAAGYEPDDTGFAASVDHGDIYGRMCFLLGLEEDGNSYVRYNNSGELEYRLKNLSVDIHNTALASPGGTYYAEVIRWFYPKTTPANVREALKGMITYNNMLIAPSRIRRFFIYALLYVSGNYKEMHGLLVNYRKNPQCEDSNRQLMQYYRQAKLSALRMISQFGTYLDESRELEPIFDYSFGSI